MPVFTSILRSRNHSSLVMTLCHVLLGFLTAIALTSIGAPRKEVAREIISTTH
jgi:hypothetical protein